MEVGNRTLELFLAPFSDQAAAACWWCLMT